MIAHDRGRCRPEMDDVELSTLVGCIYQAALDATLWPTVLNRISDAIHGRQCAAVFFDWATYTCAAVAPRQDPDYLRNYSEHWASRNFIRQRSAKRPPGDLMTISTLASEEELAHSDFYNEWLRPQGMEVALGSNIAVEGSASTLLCVYRSRCLGEFDQVESWLFSLLVPHFRNAALFAHRTASLDLGRSGAFETMDWLHLGVIIVDAAGKVIIANRMAERLLSEGDGVAAHAGRLHAATLDDTRRLGTAISDCAIRVATSCNRQLTLRRHGRPSLDALVLPFQVEQHDFWACRQACIIVLTDPEQQREAQAKVLRRRLGLTRVEAELAIEIVKGDGRQAAADRLGVSLGTARTHLTHIFEKTCVHSQAQLVRLILQTQAGTIPTQMSSSELGVAQG